MSHDKQAPQLPDVVDEAGNSPAWVPLLGLGLLCLLALFVAAREAIGHDQAKPAVAVDAGTPEPSPAEKKPAGGEPAKP